MAKRVEVGALEVEYDEVGMGERPLVMVHGFMGSRDDFADVLQPFGELGRTLVPDLRGHGGTTNPGVGYSLDQLTTDLAGFLDATGAGRCDLLGHSVGGLIALRLALDQPERLASLVLMDTGACFEAPKSRLFARFFIGIARHIPPRWFLRLARANPKRLPDPVRRAVREMGADRYWQRILDKLEAMDPAAFTGVLLAVRNQPDLADRLSEIACPTLVLVGDQDGRFLKPSRVLADGIPGAEFVIIRDAHHSPQIESREAWQAAVLAHLDRARA